MLIRLGKGKTEEEKPMADFNGFNPLNPNFLSNLSPQDRKSFEKQISLQKDRFEALRDNPRYDQDKLQREQQLVENLEQALAGTSTQDNKDNSVWG